LDSLIDGGKMGDKSIKGRSPILGKDFKNFRILNKGKKEKNVEFGPQKAEKPEPIEKQPTKKQR
tara:strand:+ start:429 stop:620 length:192 start_codon:yes stop_codon:yes gene_type:complete